MSDLREARDKMPDALFTVIDPIATMEPFALVHEGFPDGVIVISWADLTFLRALACSEIRVVTDSFQTFEFELLL